MQEFTISVGESIHIGKDVQVKAVRKHAALGITIGIQAPRDVSILQEEAQNRNLKEKKKGPVIAVRKRRTVRNTI